MASNISVVFQAFTDKFEKKTSKAGKSVAGFAKKAIAIGASFLVARAGVSKFTEAFAELSKLGELSKSLQVSPDFLRGLKIGAEEVGESFEKAQDIIKEFNIRIGEAVGVGTGPAVEALELIGIAVKDLEGLNPEEQFLKVADALSKIDNQQVKIFAAGDIFGGAGEDMLSLLEKGKKGIEDLKKKAQELGGPISREDLEKIARANIAIKNIGITFDGIIQQLAIKFAPALEDIATTMQKLLGFAKSFSAEWLDMTNIVLTFQAEVKGARVALDGTLGIISVEQMRKELKEISDTLAEQIAINLGGDGDSKGTGGKGGTKFKDLTKGITPDSIKSFAVAAQAQSSAAFDQLNPNKSSIQKDQLAVQEKIEKNTAKIAEKKSTEITFKQVSIP